MERQKQSDSISKKKNMEMKSKGVYTRILKKRIIVLEAGKCERCILGKIEDCDNCSNEVYKKLNPIQPVNARFKGFEYDINEQVRKRCKIIVKPAYNMADEVKEERKV